MTGDKFLEWRYWGYMHMGEGISFSVPSFSERAGESFLWTGYKDAHGTYVFEGDIIVHKHGPDYNSITAMYEVKYDEVLGLFIFEPDDGDPVALYELDSGGIESSKIIGNIIEGDLHQ